jgi:transketolase
MIEVVSNVIRNHDDTALFLVDLGVWAFRDVLRDFPGRAMNIGIFEDGMISVAAGLASRGITPIIYGISPYISERALEQLKIDFAYQKLGGNFITSGAAYDFSRLGYTHYCAEDLGIIKMVPGFEFVAPGTPKQFEQLFNASYNNGKPTYFRLSDFTNKYDCDVEFGKANILKRGSKATVIAVSTLLDLVMDACRDEDVTILYYTTLEPFDVETLLKVNASNRILLCEPHFEGTLLYDVWNVYRSEKIAIDTVGIPRNIIRNYGAKEQKDGFYGLTTDNIRHKLERLMI